MRASTPIHTSTSLFYDTVCIKVNVLECIRHLKKVNYTTPYYKLRVLDFNAKNSDHYVTTAHIVSADCTIIISGEVIATAVRGPQTKVRERKRQKR